MKLLWSLIGLSLASKTTAADVPRGLVYLYGRGSSQHAATTSPTIVEPQTAQLIVAQRLGLAHFYNLAGLSRSAIQQLDKFSSRSSWRPDAPAAEESTAAQSVVVVVEDISKASDVVPSKSAKPIFEISNPPASTSNAQLLDDYFAQGQIVEDDMSTKVELDTVTGPALGFGHELPGQTLFRRAKTITAGQVSPSSNSKSKSLAQIRKGVAQLIADVEAYNAQLVLIVMPPVTTGDESLRGSYGSQVRYPGTDLKRAASPSQPRASPPQKRADSDDDDDSKPVTGILPSCFSSQDDCERRTKKCSGRGSCVAKYKSDDKDDAMSCFSCQCDMPEKGSKQTTRWGGAACQKKDIVAPFWLLFTTSIFLLGAVTWGITLMYSMGAEELPSVIGAGVSGPKAR